MEKFTSLSFYEDTMKYISVQKDKNTWELKKHGDIPLLKDPQNPNNLQWPQKQREIFGKKRLLKSHGLLTLESHHTYLNMKKVNTIKKFNPQDIIRYNYENSLPILFEKERFVLDYSIDYFHDTNTTEIAFMGMPKEKINNFNRLALDLNIKSLSVNPSYQYFRNLLRMKPDIKTNYEYTLYIDSSKTFLTFVLIHKNNPIFKRSLGINEDLEKNINNYFYSLKYYIAVPKVFIFLCNTTQKTENLLLEITKKYYDAATQKAPEFLMESLDFKGLDEQILHEYQDCFIALGGRFLIESSKGNK